jgi:shikimate kinase
VNLVLVGVRGAGKSAVGRLLAERLGLVFVDLDELIESRTGETISEIFSLRGEVAFRQMESEALATLAGRDGMVLAAGGGVVSREENRVRLTRIGKTVWLRVCPEEAVHRMTRSFRHRPPLTPLSPLEEARHLAETRMRSYEEVAERVVDTNGRSPEEVCDELEQLWYGLQADDLR